MKITPNDISSIDEIGTLSGNPVKLIRTKGGFWIAVSKKRGHVNDEALSAGSHPAIVKYNLEKQYPDYAPALMKSEGFEEPIVEKHSHYLSEELRKSGHDIFSVQNESSVEFHITKHNMDVANVSGQVSKDHLILQNLNIPKEFTKAMAGAAVEKSLSCKVGLKLKA